MLRCCLVSMAAGACAVLAAATMAEPLTVAGPVLSGWIDEVVLNNPEFQAAQAAVEAAGGRLRAADQPLFNPELEFEYENSEVDTTAGGISQTIDWSDKRGARTTVADFELEGAIAELRSKRQRLATGLLEALADWHTAAAIFRTSEQQSVLLARFAHLAEQRRKAGDLGQTELDLAHLAAADAAFEQANASETLIRAQQAVAVFTATDAWLACVYRTTFGHRSATRGRGKQGERSAFYPCCAGTGFCRACNGATEQS